MPFKHLAYIRVNASLSEADAEQMLKDMQGLTKCSLVIGGAAGKNHETAGGNAPHFQYAMAFDFANPEDKKAFKKTPESQAFLSKWASYMEDASELNFSY